MKKVNVGIIGCGSIAINRHAPEYAENKFSNILGFFDEDKSRAEKLAKMYNAKMFNTVEELLNYEEIDAVSICSPNYTHFEYAKKAIISSKAVLCEKPMVMNMEEALELKALCLNHKTKFVVGHNQRFVKVHKEVKQMVSKNYLGKVLTFKTNFMHSGPENWGIDKSTNTWFFKKGSSGSGVLGDLGVHKLDLMRYMLNTDFKSVYAMGLTIDKKFENGEYIDVEDNFVVSMKMKDNSLGSASFSWSNYGVEDNSTIIYCENGVYKIFYDDKYSLIIEHKNGEIENYNYESIQTNTSQTNSGIIDHFIDVVINDVEIIASIEDGVKSIEVVEALYNSMRTRSECDLNE